MLDVLEPSFPLGHSDPAYCRRAGRDERRWIEVLALEGARRAIIEVSEKASVEAEIAAARAAGPYRQVRYGSARRSMAITKSEGLIRMQVKLRPLAIYGARRRGSTAYS